MRGSRLDRHTQNHDDERTNENEVLMTLSKETVLDVTDAITLKLTLGHWLTDTHTTFILSLRPRCKY